MGNSLRRVLLSHLEGSAVTAVRIESITHEFTTVPGVVEDVIDIMLNLKGLVVKTFSQEPQYLHLDVERPGPVTGRDIFCPADATIINPDWQICTLAEGGRIRAEITVERGRGYSPADDRIGKLPTLSGEPQEAALSFVNIIGLLMDRAARAVDPAKADQLKTSTQAATVSGVNVGQAQSLIDGLFGCP